MFSWYNLILKLQMSELLREGEKNAEITVLESIVKTLAKGEVCLRYSASCTSYLLSFSQFVPLFYNDNNSAIAFFDLLSFLSVYPFINSTFIIVLFCIISVESSI